jgi:hypothetical protein
VEPQATALVEMFPDDVAFYYGILATADGRLFQFGFDARNGEARGTFTEWRNCTGGTPHPCSTVHIEAGFKVARGDANAF